MRMTEWELLFMYKRAANTLPYLAVLLNQHGDAGTTYTLREVNRLKRLKAKLKKELVETHGCSKGYLQQLTD